MRFDWKKTIRRPAAVALVAGLSGAGAACGVSQRQEAEIGAQYAAEANRQLPIVRDAAANRYINLLGQRIARNAERNFTYRFYIVNSDEVNAFALPGGYVYVNRGLIERTDNMSELAGVLAHEIAHVDLRHGAEQIERMQAANVGLGLASILLGAPSGVAGAAVQVGGAAFFAKHGRDAEREADATAVPLLVQSGIHPRGLVTFFSELLEERKRRPSALEQWFSTHPLTEDRIEETRSIVNQIPASRLRGLAQDAQDFRSFRSRVSRLPAAPRR